MSLGVVANKPRLFSVKCQYCGRFLRKGLSNSKAMCPKCKAWTVFDREGGSRRRKAKKS